MENYFPCTKEEIRAVREQDRLLYKSLGVIGLVQVVPIVTTIESVNHLKNKIVA